MIPIEETAQPLYRNVGFDRRRIQTVARILDGVFVKVGGKNLNRRGTIQTFRMFAEQHRDRVGLFSRGTTRHPDAKLVGFAAAREELGNVCLKRRKRILVSKEMRYADEQILEKSARLHRTAQALLSVSVQFPQLVLKHHVVIPPPGIAGDLASRITRF